MKKLMIVLIALFAMVAFVSGAVAQQQTPQGEKGKAPEGSSVSGVQTQQKGETPQSQKHKAPKAMHFKGTVAAYEAGKSITVKGAKEKEMTFDVAADAKIKGEVKEGAKVTVMYKKDGDKMVATSISAGAPKKETPQSQKQK